MIKKTIFFFASVEYFFSISWQHSIIYMYNKQLLLCKYILSLQAYHLAKKTGRSGITNPFPVKYKAQYQQWKYIYI